MFASTGESCIISRVKSAGFVVSGISQGEKRDFVRFKFLMKCHRLNLYVSRFFISKRKEVNPVASVNLRNGESQDSLLKRFRKKVVKSAVLSTVRRKRWFVSKSETRRMEKKKAIRRIKRRSFKDNE